MWGGSLRWPVEGTDLVGAATQRASCSTDPLRRRLDRRGEDDLDLGVDTVRNYQQVGLVAYEDDDDLARLLQRRDLETRQTEFGRETAAIPPAPTARRAMAAPSSAPRPDPRAARPPPEPAGEHLYRAGFDRDGEMDVGSEWTFAAPAPTRASASWPTGARRPAATAEVDHLRFYASTWPDDPGAG